MFRIIKNLAVALTMLTALCQGAIHADAAQVPASDWVEDEGNAFTSRRRFTAGNTPAGNLLNPLPRAGRPATQEALSLRWNLRRISPPQSDAIADSAPDWLGKNTLWLFVNISPNVEHSYFYAPFAPGQSAKERQKAAAAVMPTELEVTDAEGAPVGGVSFYYPPGSLKQDVFSGLRLPVYQDEIMVAASIPDNLPGLNLRLKISALICTAASCAPFRKIYDLPLNQAGIAGEPSESALLSGLRDYQTAPFGLYSTPEPSEIFSGPLDQGALESRLAAYIGSLTPQYHAESLEVDDIWRAVPLGLLAGLILNFMPCVLPVISLKLGTLLGLGGWHSLEKNSPEACRARRRFRLYGVCFTLGVFVWFGLLFGVIGFTGMIWGQFFQSQEMIIGLAILLFVMALSMFGLARIPIVNVRVDNKTSLPYQAFFGGFLATLLATPCSGPLLGGVLGWAVRQSPLYLGLTLLSVAAGMSSPFILMTISPGLTRFLPKPGPWTISLERIMGFVLLGTVIYLLSMLAEAKIFVTLSALLALAFSAWLWARPIPTGKRSLTLGRVFALVLIVPALYLPFSQRAADTSWRTFSSAPFLSDLGAKNMLLDFTADWCINCRAMEITTLTERRLQRWELEYGLTFVKVDLTAGNQAGYALLQAMGSASIPLLAIIPAADPQNPTVLRDLVSPAQLEQALKQAFRHDISQDEK